MDESAPVRRKRLVVIGGGINGLAAAWSAWESSGRGPVEVILLEAGPEVGGKARSRRTDGWLFEEGPTGFLGGSEVLNGLIERAGLDPLQADSMAARRYVVRGGRAREIRMAPPQFAMSGILSPRGLVRLVGELWVPPGRDDQESVWDFAARRLGPQAADRLIAPMVLGIYAGDAKKLSLPAAFPRMAELEREYGGLFKAMFALAKLKQKGEGPTAGPAGPGAGLFSFSEGMQSLPIALAENASFEVRRGTAVTKLSRDRSRETWQLGILDAPQALEADAVVLSCDAHTSARLLRGVLPRASSELAGISMPGLAVVGLGYSKKSSIKSFPLGFGALIPRGEGFRTLGCLFDTQLFPGRSPSGSVLVRCMIGGATDPEAVQLSDQELLGITIDDMKRLFKLRDAPDSYEIVRWDKAIPQYELGHLDRCGRIEVDLKDHARRNPGLFLSGCHAAGVAFGKTAEEGWRVGELAGRQLFESARIS